MKIFILITDIKLRPSSSPCYEITKEDIRNLEKHAKKSRSYSSYFFLQYIFDFNKPTFFQLSKLVQKLTSEQYADEESSHTMQILQCYSR